MNANETAVETMTTVGAVEQVKLADAAKAICEMVAAGKTVGPFHRRCDVIEVGAIKVAGPKSPQAGRAYIELALCMSADGDAFEQLKEIRSRVFDAAKVLRLDVSRVGKIRARAFHNDPFNQVADYHADLRVYLAVTP